MAMTMGNVKPSATSEGSELWFGGTVGWAGPPLKDPYIIHVK